MKAKLETLVETLQRFKHVGSLANQSPKLCVFNERQDVRAVVRTNTKLRTVRE